MQNAQTNPVIRALNRTGGLLTTKKNPWATYLLAFFLPVLIMGLLWAISGVQPFGTRMILSHDGWHQYYPFFRDFRHRLVSGNSLFYSWTTGMGTNYLALYGYYLSSPLNWLSVLVPDSMMLMYYTLTVLIRIGCAGLFCMIFLRRTFHRCEPVQAFFSLLYALCAFLMGYYWNSIWLDTVALLPLVVLGALELLRDRKFILYVVSLALAVMSSYYIGLFVCIFMVLLFIGYNFVYWDDFAGFRSRLWRMGFFSVLALGISAVVTGPALIGLKNTSSANNTFPALFSVNIAKDTSFGSILDAVRQVVGNSAALVTPTSMTGLPNIYCGVVTVVLAIVYCSCRHISWREKVFCCFLLLFFVLSFIIRWFDYVWHGFHFPNMLPHRFSFLYSFVLLFMAYRAYTQLDRYRSLYLLFVAPALLLFLYCVLIGNRLISVVLTLILVLFCVGLLLLYGKRLITRNLLAFALCLCLLLEGTCSAVMGVHAVSTTDKNYYPLQEEACTELIAQMEEREADSLDLWRADFALKHTLNDNTLFSIPGISAFSSTCNSAVSQMLLSLGLAASVRGNRYVYEQSDPAVNLVLSLKYLIDREGQQSDPTHFAPVAAASTGTALLLANKDYVPMGWPVNTQLLGYDPTQNAVPFSRIEDFYTRMTGTAVHLYTGILPSSVTYEGAASGSTELKTSYSFESDGDRNSRICISFTKLGTGGMSLYTSSKNTGNLYLYVNDVYRCNYDDKYGQLRYIDGLQSGDVVSVRYAVKEGEKSATLQIYGANFNEAAYRSVRDQLAQQTLQVESRSDTEITGTIVSQSDSLFFTTIPYDSGWEAEVDGEPVRITPVADAFLAFPLTAGSHEIHLSYHTPGLTVSFYITLFSLVVFLLLVVLYLLYRLSRRPMTKIKLAMDGAPPEEDDVYAEDAPVEEDWPAPYAEPSPYADPAPYAEPAPETPPSPEYAPAPPLHSETMVVPGSLLHTLPEEPDAPEDPEDFLAFDDAPSAPAEEHGAFGFGVIPPAPSEPPAFSEPSVPDAAAQPDAQPFFGNLLDRTAPSAPEAPPKPPHTAPPDPDGLFDDLFRE